MADLNINAPAGQATAMAPPFWDTVQYDKKAGCYMCQLDEQWFVLTKDTLREALQITPVNNNQAFVASPSSDALINFDKWNLSWHTTGKKKATLIVIPSIRFTKLIIHHLQRRHKFHPRPDSPLHLPNEEPILGYLKFSANGTKREVFEMPIPASLITADIQEVSYYQEYLANVAKYRRYLAGETGSDPDSPAPKSTKPARKPKSTAPKAPPRPSISTPVTSAQPAPTSAPAKPQEKKRKQTTETSDKPPKAKKSIYGFIGKKRTLKEHESGKYQPLPEPKRKSPADQHIFQRRTSTPTESSRHDEPSYAELRQSESEESEKVVLGADEGGQGEGQAGPDPGSQAEGQTRSDFGAHDEGQAGSNPDEISEGQAGPDPCNAGADVQSIPSPVIHPRSDRKHMDLDVADVSPQPSTEQLDEGFTVTAYPKVQENLKLTVEEQVLLEDPSSSSGTLSSLQHMSKDISFGDLFFRHKPPESPKVHQQFKATTTETTITTTTTTLPPPPAQQQSTAEALMMKRIGELEHIMANLIQENKEMEERLDKHDWAMQAPLRNRFRDLPKADMKEILHQRMWETESYKSHEDHIQLFKALEKSMNHDHSEELAQDLAEARKKKKKGRESPKTPPGSSKTAASDEYQAWTTTDIRLRPSISLTHADLEIYEDMGPDEQAHSSDDEDIGSAHIPKASALASNYSPPLEDSLLTQTDDIATFMDWFCKRRGITELTPQDLEGPAFEIFKVFHPDVIHLQYQMEERHKLLTNNMDDPILKHNIINPLPLGGPPVRTHMRILSVVQIKVFSMYGYDYMKKIVLRRTDLNEHVIAKRDFKYLYPDDFEDLYLLNLQLHLNHLPSKDKKILTTTDKYRVQMMMRFNEIHKFSDGTLQQIDEALDYRVKEFKINRMNPGLNTRFWTRKDVDRSKAFMFAIQKRLKTRRIFRNLESFVGGRVREGNYSF
nr:histone deacetylase 14 [Tanacetum cinerariifolium]